jgi:hypothetical protein
MECLIKEMSKQTNGLNESKLSSTHLTNNSQISINLNNDSILEKEDKTNVCFVEYSTNGCSGRQPKQMQNAFNSLKAHKFDPKWIQSNEVFKIKSFENYLFIIDSFDGQIFDYLVERKARIIGPLSVLYCYSNECKTRFKTLPIKSYPIYSHCMRKLIVCLSSFEGQRKSDLINKIERMCGIVSKDFTNRVSHLVSDSVITKKYKVASSLNKTVITSGWVDFCWERHQHLLCHANDESIINKYRLPIFYNLMITVSQVFRTRTHSLFFIY